MSIYLNKDSRIIVQGMTGSEGSKHTKRMLRAGTNVVGGVTPDLHGVTDRDPRYVEADQAVDAVKKAVDEAEVMAGLQIDSVYVGVAGDHDHRQRRPVVGRRRRVDSRERSHTVGVAAGHVTFEGSIGVEIAPRGIHGSIGTSPRSQGVGRAAGDAVEGVVRPEEGVVEEGHAKPRYDGRRTGGNLDCAAYAACVPHLPMAIALGATAAAQVRK